MRLHLAVLSLCFLYVHSVFAQFNFSAKAERTIVTTGEQIIVLATLVSEKNLGSVPTPPVSTKEGFSVLRTDQRQSSTSSIQIINGKTTRKTEIHYQFYYYLMPSSPGKFVFPSLEITVEGKQLKTNPISFTVQDEPVKNADIRTSLSINKRTLYTGEQALVTFKVAQRAQSSTDVRGGFNSALEQIEKAFGSDFSLNRLFTTQVTTSSEQINGELYNTYLLRFSLFPVTAGTFKVPGIPFQYDELRRSRRRRADPFFDDFFSSDFFGGGVQSIPKNSISNTLTITVKPLPSTPAGFTGAVGKVTLSASASPLSVPSGEAVTLRVTLNANTRSGSIGEVQMPQIDECEIFKPEIHVSSDTGSSGLSTRKSYKYLIIPRDEGTLVIPPVTFPYFDPDEGVYKKASSKPVSITVTKGKSDSKPQTRYLTQEEIREIGQDIRYLKTDVKLRNETPRPHRDPVFFLLFPLPFFIFFASLLYRFQSSRRERNADMNYKRKAMAGALKQISALKKNGPSISVSDFLGKVADIIEQYISQKFGFAATGRTLEELKAELLENNADEKTVSDLTQFVEDLDKYRFGGVSFDENQRSSVLEKTRQFLSGLEKSKTRKSTAMHTIIVFFFLLIPCLSFSSPADNWFEKANQFYTEEKYDSSLVYYQKILESGVNSSTVLYNLGNTYYRQKKIGLARLYYEKAALVNPGDPDIQANIRFVRSNIVDRTPEPQRGFLEVLMWNVHILFPLKTQLWISLGLLLLISVLVSFCLFISGNLRLWLIYVSVMLFLVFGVNSLSTGFKIYQSEKVSHAIVLSASVDARNGPDGNKVLFTAHEGTKFRIRKTDGSWSLVSLPNGVSGWVKNDFIGKI